MITRMTATTTAAALTGLPTKKTAVLYHYPCPDGAFAALAAHLYFSASSTPALFFPNTVYTPLRLEELPLNEIDDVYLLDFVGFPGFVKQLSAKVDRVVVLDHHKTALEMLGDGKFAGDNVLRIIDMERSGATIAFDFFKEKLLALGDIIGVEGECEFAVREFDRARKLFEYIEDADLWRWRLHNSKAFSSGLKDLNIEFDPRLNPSLFKQLNLRNLLFAVGGILNRFVKCYFYPILLKFRRPPVRVTRLKFHVPCFSSSSSCNLLLSLDVDSVINQGLTSLSEKQRLINEVLEQSYEIAIGGGEFGHCLAVNADSISELRSELGHQLANKSCKMNLRGIGAIVYKVPELGNDEMLKISLRSIENEDTTPISQKFGGGGHRNASSFMLSSAEFGQWRVSVNGSTSASF